MKTNELNAKPWWQSTIIIGIAVSLVAKALVVFGLAEAVSGPEQEALVNAIVSIIGAAGDVYAIAGRVTQKTAPTLTLTKGAAAEANAPVDPTEGGPWELHDEGAK